MSPIMATRTNAPPTPIPAAAPALSLLLPSDEVLPAGEVVPAAEPVPVVDVPAVGMTSVKVGVDVSPDKHVLAIAILLCSIDAILVKGAKVLVDTGHSEHRTIIGFDLNIMP
jgi:hypothetical protein